jgi:Concanavalin A-like lectin/glucanases superfamily
MTVKRFSRLFCQLTGFVMFASLSIWSISTFAACNDTVPNGLVACYPFDGNANDASGKGNNGTVNGATLTTDRFGKQNSAYQFDGNSYIEVKDSNSLDLTTGFTMSAWVNSQGQIIDNLCPICTGGGIILNKEAAYEMALTAKTSTIRYALFLNGSIQWTDTGVSVALNQWTLIAVSYDGNTIKVYKSGILVHQRVEKGSIPTTNHSAGIGSRQMGQSGYPYWVSKFNGQIDDVRIYNRALTDAEVKQLYNEANPEPVVCAPANYTNGVLKVPFITIDGVTDAYKATMLQYNSGFAFRVTESAVITGKSNCPATYSPTTGILHIPLVKTKSAIPLNTFQCYDVTMQAFSDRFQLDLETLKVVKCP